MSDTWRLHTTSLAALEGELAQAEIVSDHGQIADLLFSMGQKLNAEGLHSDALPHLTRALSLVRDLEDLWSEGMVLNELAAAAVGLGRPSEAIELAERALEIFSGEAPDRGEQGRSLVAIAEARKGQGDLEPAREALSEALVIAEEVGDPQAIGATLNNLSNLYGLLGDPQRSLDYSRRSLKLARARDDPWAEATAVSNAIVALDALGRPRAALREAEATLTRCRKIGYASLEATLLSSICALLNALGRPKEGLARGEEALDLQERLDNPAGTAYALNNIAGSLIELGRLREAGEELEESLAIRRDIGDRHAEITALSNLGALLESRGRHDEALERFEEALAIAEAVGDRRAEAMVRINLAGLLHEFGDLREAQRLLDSALGDLEALGDRGSAVVAMVNLTYLARRERWPLDDVISWARRSLELARKTGRRSLEVGALLGLGRCLAASGNATEARASFEEALRIAGSLPEPRSRMKALLGLAGFLVGVSEYEEALRWADEALAAIEDFEDEVVQLTTLTVVARALRGLGRTEEAGKHFEAAAEIVEQRQTGLASAERRAGNFSEFADVYAQLAGTLFERQDSEGALLASQRTKARELARYLEGDGAGARPPVAEGGSVDLGSLCDLVKPASAILDYCLPSEGPGVLFCLTAGSLRAIELPPRDEIESMVRELRSRAEDPEAGWCSHSHELFQALVEPAWEYIDGKDELVVCPDGALHRLPLQLLCSAPDGDSGSAADWKGRRFLVRDFAIRNVPSLAVAKRLAARDRRGEDHRFALDLLAVAPGNATSSMAEEVSALGAAFERRELMAGDQATRAAVHERIADAERPFRYLHLAAHGLVDDWYPARSGMELTPVGDEDHVWRAEEIAGARLEGCELVTLAGCRTADGRLLRGEGVAALSLAFVRAGVRAVCGALWEIADHSTVVLIEDFYAALREGDDPPQALRRAQLKALDSSRAHPFHWAAFVVTA